MLEPIDALLRTTLGSPELLEGYLYPFILSGFALTLKLALASLALAVALGMLGAVAKLSRSRLRSRARGAGVYTTVVRGVPDIVLMFILFFGGQIFVNYCGVEPDRVGRAAEPAARLGLRRDQRVRGRDILHRLHLRGVHDRDVPGRDPRGFHGARSRPATHSA